MYQERLVQLFMLNEKKIVLVTGASRGIGQAIARRFAKEGYAVVMHYHTGRFQAEQTAAELQAQGLVFCCSRQIFGTVSRCSPW